MQPQTLLSKLQSHATPDQALIQEEVKDSSGTIIHQFNAGMFGLVVKPAFSSLSKNYDRVMNGHHISLPVNPEYVRDKQGLLVNIKMQFSVKPVNAAHPPKKVVIHLYSTQTKLMTQGASSISDSPSNLTTAQWFVVNFVFPTIEAQVARSGTSKDHVAAMNNAIMRLRPAVSHVSSLHHLPALSHQSGVNTPSVDIRCAYCDAQIDGRTKIKKTCDSCKGIFHSKCLPNHLCPPAHLQPSVIILRDTEDMTNLSPPPTNVPTTSSAPSISHLTSVITASTSSSTPNTFPTSASIMTLLTPFLPQPTPPSLRPLALPFIPSTVSTTATRALLSSPCTVSSSHSLQNFTTPQ